MEITREEKIKLEQSKRFWSLVLFLPVAIIILWLLLGVLGLLLGYGVAQGATSPFLDNFDSYGVGDLTGQNNWIACPGFPYSVKVSTMNSQSSPNSARIYNPSGNACSKNETTITDIPNGFQFYFYATDPNIDSGEQIVVRFFNPVGDPIVYLYCQSGVDLCYYKFNLSGAGTDYVEIDADVWHKLEISWAVGVGGFTKIRAKLNDGDWEQWYQMAVNTTPQFLRLQNWFGESGKWFVDDITKIYVPEKVWAISPASETEITSLTATFEFGWEGLDDYDSLSIVFHNRPTGIFSEAKVYEIETIGTSGSIELSFENFNFDRNGKFYFYAIASKYVPTVIDDMYLTGGYSYEWSGDLVDPEHWFTINISGITPVFEMSDFETWYSAEAKFATPTALFVSITGFFEPIFNKIGEFGSRIVDYFNVNEAYSQGYEIGKAIPFFAFFVGETSLFLGGFPILKWLFIVMLLLVGIFIFRLILKFIPGLG